jgi:16S rRNA (guanine966-N2)-methyltransferase
LRVVSGKYRGRRFNPPKKFPSRPTTDMAKEALFNILENKYEWDNLKVLDLFSGTGNISIEFLSRGVKEVVSVEKHHICIRHLNKLKTDFEVTNWSILKKDAFKFISDFPLKFDIVFADPPFDHEETKNLPDLIYASDILTSEGVLIIEHGRENSFKSHPKCSDTRNYGGVFFSIFGG